MNKEVTKFLDEIGHPFRKEIDQLRAIVLKANAGLMENIKWNGPNYIYKNEDRITMKIHPPTHLQLIFHRGAKVMKQPTGKLIKDAAGLLEWRGNDRAFATFKTTGDITEASDALKKIINDWIKATS
jgi:hypothetical protein